MAFATYLLSEFKFGDLEVTSRSTATIEETSQVNQHSADASRAVNLVTVDRIGSSITIETFDNSIHLDVGDCDKLEMKGVLRGCGSDLTTTTAITITVDDAVVTNASTTLNSEGESTTTISFEGYDPDADESNDPSVITYS